MPIAPNPNPGRIHPLGMKVAGSDLKSKNISSKYWAALGQVSWTDYVVHVRISSIPLGVIVSPSCSMMTTLVAFSLMLVQPLFFHYSLLSIV